MPAAWRLTRAHSAEQIVLHDNLPAPTPQAGGELKHLGARTGSVRCTPHLRHVQARSPTSTLAAGLSTYRDLRMVAPSLVTMTWLPRPMLCRILSCSHSIALCRPGSAELCRGGASWSLQTMFCRNLSCDG